MKNTEKLGFYKVLNLTPIRKWVAEGDMTETLRKVLQGKIINITGVENTHPTFNPNISFELAACIHCQSDPIKTLLEDTAKTGGWYAESSFTKCGYGFIFFDEYELIKPTIKLK